MLANGDPGTILVGWRNLGGGKKTTIDVGSVFRSKEGMSDRQLKYPCERDGAPLGSL